MSARAATPRATLLSRRLLLLLLRCLLGGLTPPRLPNPRRSPSDLLGQQKDGSRLYNPYAGLGNQGFDLSRTLLELPDAPEFVFSEEALVRHRGWSENLTYITGGAYMGGALAGGAYGGYRALTTKVEGIPDTTKLRVNRVLNVGGGFGRNLGNNLGVLGLFYSTFESLSSYVREEHDSLNSIIAAGGTGAMYKCVSGPRAAAVWGAGCVFWEHGGIAAALQESCAASLCRLPRAALGSKFRCHDRLRLL